MNKNTINKYYLCNIDIYKYTILVITFFIHYSCKIHSYNTMQVFYFVLFFITYLIIYD